MYIPLFSARGGLGISFALASAVIELQYAGCVRIQTQERSR